MSVTVGNRAASVVSTPAVAAAPASDKASGLEGLCRGSKGPEVKALQETLNARGATLETDGKFGPLTEAALKKFQADAGCKGAGRVDASTVAALKTPATPTAAATPAAKDDVNLSCSAGADRAKTLGTTSTAGAKPALPTVTTPSTNGAAAAAAPSTSSVKLAPAQVDRCLAAIDVGIQQANEEKAVLGQAKEALRREVTELETPIKGATATVADQAVLMGRKGQLDAVEKAEGLVDLKLRGYDSAAISVGDGTVTGAEADALKTIDTAFKKGETAVATLMQTSSALVDKGLQAGGRGKPSLGLRKPDAALPATTPTAAGAKTLNASDVELGRARIQTAVAGATENLVVVGRAKRELKAEITTLAALKDPTPADAAVLAGRQAQLQVLDGASQQLNTRIAGLQAADKAIADGVLTDSEASNLAKADTALGAAQQALAAQANLATELIRHGLAAGGRGSDQML